MCVREREMCEPHLPVIGPHLSRARVRDLLVQTDVEVVAAFVGQEQADGDLLARGREPDVDLQLGLEHAQLPQAAAVTHHHGAHRLLDLKCGQHTQRFSLGARASN